MSKVTAAINHVGISAVARRVGYRPSAVQHWRDEGCLPMTDLAGLTQYASIIAQMSHQKFSTEELIDASYVRWQQRIKANRKRFAA